VEADVVEDDIEFGLVVVLDDEREPAELEADQFRLGKQVQREVA
jgi:hypothetical protein